MDERTRRRAHDLLAALADGDRAAFSPLFQLLWPIVHRFARRALGSDADAEEVAQGAMLRIFERASDFDPARDAMTWALTIAAWECRTLRRRRQRRREVSLAGDSDAGGTVAPADLAELELEAAAVEVLGQLSAADVQVLLAWASDDPGRHDGVRPATFRKRLERALGRLRFAWRSRYGAL